MKAFYNALKANLLAKLPAVKTVSKWNNQMIHLDQDNPFERPAIFIEIESVVWDKTNKTSKRGIVTFILHVISDCYDTQADDDDAMDALDLTDEATDKMEASKLTNCTPFINISTVLDNDHADLIDNKVMFTTEYTKCVGNSKSYEEVSPELELTKNITP